MKKRVAIGSIVAVALVLVLAGCSPLFNGPGGGTGSVELSVSQGDARTVQPTAASITVTSYTVSGTGPGGASLPSTTQTTSPFTLSGLAAGSWTLTVNGKDASGNIIATGSASVMVTSGSTATATVTLEPISGSGVTGTFTMSATWSSPVVVNQLTGTITPVGGTAQSFTASISGSTASYSNSTLPVGSYTLTLCATSSTGATCRSIYALRIYKLLVSPLTITYTAADFTGAAGTTMTINPATVDNGVVGTTYSFTLTATGIPSGISSVTFAWSFGDGTAGSSASATVSSGTASKVISHSYSTQSSFGLVASVSNGSTVLANATAAVTIGQATTRADGLTVLDTWHAAQSGGYGLTVDIWDISVLPVGAKFDIQYDMMSVPDRCIIEYPAGTIVYDSGWRGDSSYAGANYPGGIVGIGQNTVTDLFIKGSVNSFKVTIIGPDPGTAWDYSMRAHL